MTSISTPSQRARFVSTILIAGIVSAVIFWRIQFSTPYIAEYDGYYHIKFAERIRETGFVENFPWLPLTTFSERFADMHFLLHYLMVPFTLLGLMEGAKWYAVTSGVLVVITFCWFLQKEKVPGSLLWTFLLFTSPPFLYRFSLPKAGQVSLLVCMAVLHLMWSKKYRSLMVVSFAYTWLYVAFPIVLVVCFFHILSTVLLKESLDVKPIAFVALGMGAGMLFNPYFPDNIWYCYVQTFLISMLQQIPMGNEWHPWTTWFFLTQNSIVLASMVLALLYALVQKGPRDSRSVTLFLVAVLFLFLTFKSRRFVEYFVPFGVLSSACMMKEIVPYSKTSGIGSRWIGTIVVIVAVCIAVSSYHAVVRSSNDIQGCALRTLNPFYEKGAAWLKHNTPKDSMVFNSDWDDFPALFFYNTHNRYVVGLDPNFLYLHNAKLWQTYTDITLGRIRTVSGIIPHEFGASYVFTDRRHVELIRNLRSDTHMVLEYQDEYCAIYRVAQWVPLAE